MNRRQFLKTAAAVAGAAFVGDAIWEAHRLVVTRYDVPSPTLPPALDGLRIAHLSDLHLPCAAAERAVDAIAAEQPDVVVVTGDTISRRRKLELVTPYMQRVRGKLATIAVRGNNDHWAKVSRSTLANAYAAAGAQLLDNQHTTIAVRDGKLQIVGLDDPSEGHPDVAAATKGIDPSLPTIWLLHAPGFIDRIAPNPPSVPPALLVLGGHTHGGQIRGPGCTPVVPRGSGRFRQGWYDAALGRVYITRGVGTSVVPMRFLCPPELPIFTLRRT